MSDSYTTYKEIKYILKHDSHRQYLNGARKVSLCSKMSKKLPTFKDYLIKSDFYVKKKINAQCLIVAQGGKFFEN